MQLLYHHSTYHTVKALVALPTGVAFLNGISFFQSLFKNQASERIRSLYLYVLLRPMGPNHPKSQARHACRGTEACAFAIARLRPFAICQDT
jgi:hypothetical protein